MAGPHTAEVERLRRKIWAVREELLHCQARAEKELPRPADPAVREGLGAPEKGEAIVAGAADRQQAEPAAVAPTTRGAEVEVAVLAKLQLQSQLIGDLSRRLALLRERVAAQPSRGTEGEAASEKAPAPECPQRKLRAEVRERRRAELERLRLEVSKLPARTRCPVAQNACPRCTQPIAAAEAEAEVAAPDGAGSATPSSLQQTQPIQLLPMPASNETPRDRGSEGDLRTPRGSSRPRTSTPPPPPPPNSTPRGRPSPGGPPGPPPPAKAKAKAPSAAPPPPKARGKSRPSRPQAGTEVDSGEDVEAAEPGTKLVNLHWRASLEPKPNEITAICDPYLGGVVEFLPKWGRERSERCQERLARYETAVGLSAAAAYEAVCTPRGGGAAAASTPRHGDVEGIEMEDTGSVVATPRTVLGTPRESGPILPIEKRERRRTIFTGECRVEELSRHKLREFFQVRSASVDIGTARELPSGAGVTTLIPDAKHRKILDILVRKEAMEQRTSVDVAVDELLRALRFCDYSRATPEMLVEFRKVAAAHMEEKGGGRSILAHVASQGEASLQQLEHPHLHRLLFGMLQIPLISTRLECMILEATFDEQVQHCSNNLEVLGAALECLRDRLGPLRSLFAATLRVGNALNQDSNAPVAGYGFKLCTLPKLLELRMPIRKEVSLFHFLLLWMRPEEVEALCNPEAIEALQRAQAARTYTVYQDLLQQLESYARIQQFAETGFFTEDPQASQDDVGDRDNTFRLRMRDFSAKTRDRVAYLWKFGYNIFRAYADFGRFLDDLRLVYPPPKEEREDKKDLFCVFHSLFTTVARVRGEVLEQKLHEDVRNAFNIIVPFSQSRQAVVTPPVEVAPPHTFGEVTAEPAAKADAEALPTVQSVDATPATEPVLTPTERGVPVAAVSAAISPQIAAPRAAAATAAAAAAAAAAVPICGLLPPHPQRPPSPFRRLLPAQEPLGPPPNRPARPLIPVPKSLSWHPLVPQLELPLKSDGAGAALEVPPPVMSPWALAASPGALQPGRSPGGGLRQPSPSARLGRKSLTRIANRLASEAMRDHSSATEDISSTDPAMAAVGSACSLTPKSHVLPSLMLEEAALEGGGPDLQAQIWMELRRRKSHGPGHPSTPGTPQLVVATVADGGGGGGSAASSASASAGGVPEQPPDGSPTSRSPCLRYCPLPRVEEVAEAEVPGRAGAAAGADRLCGGGGGGALSRSLRGARPQHLQVQAR